MVPKADSTPLTNGGAAAQHRLAQINSGLSTPAVFSPRYSPSTVPAAAPLRTPVLDDSPPPQTTTAPATAPAPAPSAWEADAFRLYDALMPKALAAGGAVAQHDLPWPVLAKKSRKSAPCSYSPRRIHSADVTPAEVARFVALYCAWKGWCADVGRAQMLADWGAVQTAFPPGKAGVSKVRKVVQGISAMV